MDETAKEQQTEIMPSVSSPVDITGANNNSGKNPDAGANKKKALILIAITLLVLSVLTLVSWWLLSQKNGVKVDETSKKINKVKINTSLPPEQQAEQAMFNGDYDEAQSILEAQSNKEKSTEEKITLYRQLATNALNANQMDDAQRYAEQAEKLSPSSTTASLLAYVAEERGQTSEAKRYYELAITRLDKNSDDYDLRLANLQRYIRDVSR